MGARDWNVARRRLQFPSFRSLNVWFHSPPRDYRKKVKAYMCMCSCHEWIMYSDSRDRWIYDHQLKRIWLALTLNQEVLVKSCYNPQPWTHSRSLLVLPQSLPIIRVQESFKFQLRTKLPKIANWHFLPNINLNAFQRKQLDVPLPQCSLSPYPTPSPYPWQMALINIDMITRFPAINTHSSYGFKC